MARIVQHALDKTNTAIPAFVVSYNAQKQTVDVQVPFVDYYEQAGTDEPQTHAWPELPDVPVIFPRGGDWSISWPLKKGDNVLLVFSQRSIDDWYITNGQGSVSPQDLRAHDISDAFAIPGPPTDQTALNADAANSDDLIIRHSDGTTLKLGKNKISSLTGDRFNIGSEQASTPLAKAPAVDSRLGDIEGKVNAIIASSIANAGLVIGVTPLVPGLTTASNKVYTND